jgi:two-component system CheB/CheR fusion protein
MRDLGRPIQDLDFSYKPVEIRSGIDQAFVQRRPVTYKDVAWAPPGGDMLVLDLRVTPVLGHGGETIGVAVTAEDVTHAKRLQEELVNINQELETAYEEVQSTNEELQTTNEELQSTVEELETTNEELQSTNEELETLNEELQSTNEELETINEEIRVRSTNLNQTNAFLESVMGSLRDGVIVVDRDLKILAWNNKSEDLWGLRSDEVQGKHFLNLDTGLPMEPLLQPVRACLQAAGPQRIELEATNRRGRKIQCAINCTPLLDLDGTIRGAIILVATTDSA